LERPCDAHGLIHPVIAVALRLHFIDRRAIDHGARFRGAWARLVRPISLRVIPAPSRAEIIAGRWNTRRRLVPTGRIDVV